MQTENKSSFHSENTVISIKELIVNLKFTVTYLWGFRWLLLIMSLLGGFIGFGYAHYFRSVTYTSRLTFVVEEKSSGGGNLMGLASQLGLDLGGGGGGLFSSENIILLVRSKNILESALLEPLTELNGDHLLNFYISNHFTKSLKEGKLRLYDTQKNRESFNRHEDSVLSVVVTQTQNLIRVSKLDKKASIIDLELTDKNEKWAYLMSKCIIENATEMYLELKIGKTSRTIGVLESRVDSVKSLLDKMMSAAAIENDQNQGLILMRGKVPAAKKQLQIQLLSSMYGELVKNLELTRFTLQREEPVIQIVDSPRMPLHINGQGRVRLALILSFIAFILSSFVLLANNWYRSQ